MPFPRHGDISFEYTKRKIQFQSWINLVSQDKRKWLLVLNDLTFKQTHLLVCTIRNNIESFLENMNVDNIRNP